MSEIGVISGQSNYDITLQAYGCLDCFIKILSDNSINTSTQLLSTYKIDDNEKLINSNFVGTKYATQNFYQDETFSTDGSYNDFGGSYN